MVGSTAENTAAAPHQRKQRKKILPSSRRFKRSFA